MAHVYRRSWSDQCAHDGCITLLSRYNDGGGLGGQLCFLHQRGIPKRDLDELAGRLARR